MELNKFFCQGAAGSGYLSGRAQRRGPHARLCGRRGAAPDDGDWHGVVFSRSRQKLWNKGETSGNVIFVSKILSDCDDDTLIYVGTPKGPVCHTGNHTCFFTTLWEKERHL